MEYFITLRSVLEIPCFGLILRKFATERNFISLRVCVELSTMWITLWITFYLYEKIEICLWISDLWDRDPEIAIRSDHQAPLGSVSIVDNSVDNFVDNFVSMLFIITLIVDNSGSSLWITAPWNTLCCNLETQPPAQDHEIEKYTTFVRWKRKSICKKTEWSASLFMIFSVFSIQSVVVLYKDLTSTYFFSMPWWHSVVLQCLYMGALYFVDVYLAIQFRCRIYDNFCHWFLSDCK